MRQNLFLICLIFLGLATGCKTQKKDTPESKNILGYKGGVIKVNPDFDTTGKHATFSKKAIKTCKYLVTNIKQDYPEAFTILGMLYDKLNKKKNAEYYYKKAIKAYTKRINSKEEILDMINKAHLIYIMDNKRGLNEIDSLINAYPSNEELLIYKKYLFTDYNHQDMLNEL